MAAIRRRIKELRWIPAGQLKPHPENWRRHPPEQRAALERVLAAVGWAGALTARQLDDGQLELTDGHLRRDVSADELVPVLVTDLDEDEARTMLLATDPLAAMAQADVALLEALMAQADPDVLAGIEPTLSKLLLSADGFQPAKVDAENEWRDMPEYAQEDLRPFRTIHVHFKNAEDVQQFSEKIGQPLGDRTGWIWFPPVAREARSKDEP